MMEKLERMLKKTGGFYTVGDILSLIEEGRMQSFSDGHTWVVTQVHEFPQRKVVDIVFVVGDLRGAADLESKVDEFAKSVGATAITATGRMGWLKRSFAGWKPHSCNFIKEI